MSRAFKLLIPFLLLGSASHAQLSDSQPSLSSDPATDSRDTGSSENGPDRAARTDENASTWRWQKSNSVIALLRGKKVIWQFNFGPDRNTPCFHPVSTAGGQVLSWDRPPDHAWHHGVWFSWKFINGVNYWEHNQQTGRPDGRTSWSEVEIETRDDYSARITMVLKYHPATEDQTVLSEHRRIDISSPVVTGVYHMDWTSSFDAGASAVTLDRTPPQEQSWGGYAGLSVRFAKDLVERQAISDEESVEFDDGNRHRSRARAMDYSGLIDGRAVGLAFLDHSGNPRHPTPWYLIRDPVMSYINAALLNYEPLSLKPGQRMTLRYRLVLHPDRWSKEHLQAAYETFQQAKVSPDLE